MSDKEKPDRMPYVLVMYIGNVNDIDILDSLEVNVSNMMDIGYVPVGGIAVVAIWPDQCRYIQAMRLEQPQ